MILNRQIRRWADRNNISIERIIRVDHHAAHAYSGHFSSGLEQALIVTLDGQGLGVSATVSLGIGSTVHLVDSIGLPNSAGQFYSLVTLVCGLVPNRHEGKITGLAAFGKANVELQMFVNSLLTFDAGKIIGHAIYGNFLKARKLLRRYGREDLSFAFQQRLEEVTIAYIEHHFRQYPKSRNIVLSGGVFSNVRLVQKIQQALHPDHIFVYPHMADGGSGFGAACLVDPMRQVRKLPHVYLGAVFSPGQLRKFLEEQEVPYNEPTTLAVTLATMLRDGKVIGRFDGRMEFGPRALGNRSILMYTLEPQANDRLNKKLGRTEFMPFAPVTLIEEASTCYHIPPGSEHAAGFMTITYDCTAEMKRMSPAVVHVDGTARPQLLRQSDNPAYYELLRAYFELTGIPSLINTSFNMHEEPIVCSPADALRAARRAGLDALVLGPYLITELNNIR